MTMAAVAKYIKICFLIINRTGSILENTVSLSSWKDNHQVIDIFDLYINIYYVVLEIHFGPVTVATYEQHQP